MTIYYKVLVKGMKHYDFQYEIGENILKEEFNPNGNCEPGGFYICDLENVCYWLDLYDNMATICEVVLFKESRLQIQGRKYKTDKLILQNPLPIADFLEKYNLCENALQECPYNIKYIKNPSEEVQMAAVKQNGLAIKYIVNSSEELKMAAVQQNGWAIEYIENPSEEVQMAAVQQNKFAIQCIANPFEKVKQLANLPQIEHS